MTNMFRYEGLIGLRNSLLTAHGTLTNGKKLFKCLSVNVHQKNNSSAIQKLHTIHNSTGVICAKRIHTQISASYQVAGKGRNFEVDVRNKTPGQIEDKQFATDDLIHQVARKQTEPNFHVSKDEALTYPEAIEKWLFGDAENVPRKEIQKNFSAPKLTLHNYYSVVGMELKIDNPLIYSSKHSNVKSKAKWHVSYKVKWPTVKTFHAHGSSKSSASNGAAIKVLYWLQSEGRMLQNKMPILYDKSERNSLFNSSEELVINSGALNKINEFLNKYETDVNKFINECEEKTKEEFVRTFVHKLHVISDYKIDPDERNEILLKKFMERPDLHPDLPIFNYKDEIINKLEENQALVIQGDTGCGKTTKVPQFILDYFAQEGKASECNMIVTQPRRLSAVSLAERIAYERHEYVGDVVGYHVRLQYQLPKTPGSLLFCTTGILLKKLQVNPSLEGCSHVIVDEAHERNVEVDMLLVLLKRAMKVNPSLKVLIMSATINADMFQQYFNCKSITVPGRLYPVETHFLEDIQRLGVHRTRQELLDDEAPLVDLNAISDLIIWLDSNKPPGAILCFLPGWGEISKVQRALEACQNESNQIVIPVHSRLPYISQSKIFDPPEEGKRKIILATDIAETGITVPDVVYVVDSAARKEVRWLENKGLSSIDTFWVSKANVNQRKGRAGRVQKGESYHFITKKQYLEMASYPIPEVLRVPLEKVVLDGKIYSNEKAEEFLSSMPNPPRITSVKKAVRDLQDLGALDLDENLTDLGRRIALFSIHPKLSKAMVYGSIFQCLSPVATVSSVLSLDNSIFSSTLFNKGRLRTIKILFHCSSDHLSSASIYAGWLALFNKGSKTNTSDFCREHNLHYDRMMILHKTRNANLLNLQDSKLILDVDGASNLRSEENKYAKLNELVRGILLSGLDQILQHRNFEIKKGRISFSGNGSLVTEDDSKAQLTTESVNYKRKNWPSPYLIYYEKTHSNERLSTVVRESSMISPVTALLFSQGRVSGKAYIDPALPVQDENIIQLTISGKSNVKLHCNKTTAQTILRFRDIMWLIARYFISNNVPVVDYELFPLNNEQKKILHYKSEMLSVLEELLRTSAQDIEKLKPEKDEE